MVTAANLHYQTAVRQLVSLFRTSSITMEIDKNTKYDRQLRLWETSGQLRLELWSRSIVANGHDGELAPKRWWFRFQY